MSEFNRIVGVDGNHNFPEPVRKKIFSSTESNAFKTGIVNEYKGLINTSVNAAKTESSARDTNLETKINAEVNKLNNKIDTSVNSAKSESSARDAALEAKITAESTKLNNKVDTAIANLDSNKMNNVSGGKPGDVLSFDGQKSVWTKIEKEVPPLGKTGHVLTKTETGVEWSDAPSPNVIWTKDLQARVQGFWIVNSTEPPEKPFYTCEDGTVVPVIWHQPIEVLIPTLPTRPYFYPNDTKIGVEDRVGLDYYIESYTKDGVERTINRKLLSGENDLSDIAQVPFDVKVVVKPRVGYKIPAEFVWNMHYYDPNSEVVFGTETFDDKPNDSFVINRPFGDTGGYWTYAYRQNHLLSFPMDESSTYYTNGINPEQDGNGAVAKVYNGKLRLSRKNEWGVVGVKTLSDKMKVVINFSRIPTDNYKDFTIALSSNANDLITGNIFRISSGDGIWYWGETRERMTAPGDRLVPGTYIIESIGDRMAVTTPSGEKMVRSVPPGVTDKMKKENRYGPGFGIRVAKNSIDPNDPFEIDYIRVTNYGV